jgi:hypothetical protein
MDSIKKLQELVTGSGVAMSAASIAWISRPVIDRQPARFRL